MTEQFEGRVALVTGAASGIGRATALAFAREGAKVAVADIDVEGGEATVRMVERLGGKAIFIEVDVARAAEVEAMVKKTVDAYGRLDFAHNNAGVGPRGPLVHEETEEDFDHCFAVNVKGVWLGMKYQIPQMLRQGGGVIVNTASISGLVANAEGISAHIASKHAVIGLTKAAALEFARKGIRVNCVCPGGIPTAVVERYWEEHPEAREEFLGQSPIGRFGTPEEIAEAVVWLCSDGASFVHGHPLVVDGAYVVQ